MPRKPSIPEGGTRAEAPRSELSDVDRLIAEAEAAALEANVVEVQKKLTRKKASAEAAQRAEELRVKFASLNAGDAFVEDYAYEWMLAAAEAETDAERQFGIDEKIANLRKAGDALRRLATFEPKTEKMLAQMTKLKQAHDALFEVVRAAAMEALEGIRNKYKGEETEFERQAGALADSPLIRGVRREADTPEAREQALKHEIVEVMLRPLVDTDMALLQNWLNKSKSLLAEVEAACAKLQEDKSFSERFRVDDERRLYERLTGDSYTGVLDLYSIHSHVGSAIRQFRSRLEELEKQVLDDSIVLETNRSIIEETLREEHDERVLEEALVDLRQHLGALRERAAGRSDDRNIRFVPKTRLAQLVFGRYLLHGARRRMMQGFVLAGKTIRSIDSDKSLEQLIGRIQRGSDLSDFERSSIVYFISSKLGIDDRLGVSAHTFYSRDQFMTESLTGWYAQITTQSRVKLRTEASEQDRASQEACRVVIQKYPDLASFLGAFFGGESYYLNLRRASQKVRGMEPEKLPDRLSVIGWKESKGGAFVETGGDARAADRRYNETIERLSRPILRTETAFDVRGSEGEYRVYTMDQAMSLLRRSRADAKVIFGQSDRIIRDLRTQVGNLEGRVGTLNAEIEVGKMSAKSRDGEIERLTEKVRSTEERLKQTTADLRTVSMESVRTKKEGEAERSRILSRLKALASRKTGLFGGGLRADLEALIKDLEER